MTKNLLLATTNSGKTAEMRGLLRDLEFVIVSLSSLMISETFPETGRTFRENARGKSLFYSRLWPGLTLAEDSGLEIEHLGGAPGVISARFAGSQASDADNITKVLRLMQGVPAEQRQARFVCVMVLSQSGRIIKEIEALAEGTILEEKRGHSGFGYDPIFFYPPRNRTFAEMSTDEKNSISHRGRALKSLKQFLQRYLGNEPAGETPGSV